MKKLKIINWIAGLALLVLITPGVLAEKSGPVSGQQPQFGYHVLKIAGKFVGPEIFAEEQNKFFARWHANATMIHKSEEERMDILLEQIIDRVVVDEYLNRYAKITVSPREVDDYINRYIKPKYPTEHQMQVFLTRSNFNSETDLKKAIDLYLHKLKCFPKVAREFGLTIPAAELEKQYQEHMTENSQAEIRHILISDPDPGKAQKLAWEVYGQLKNGAEFAKLAAQYSADTGTISKGGLMGAFTPEKAGSILGPKIFSVKAGELIPPFQTQSGYEIILVQRFIGFYHPKPEFENMLLVESFGNSPQFNDWLAQIKPKMAIEILDPAMNAYRLYRNGRFEQAGASYERVYAVSRNQNHLDRAIESYRSAKKWVKLAKLGRLSVKQFPSQISYYLDTAEGLYRAGDVKAASQFMKKAEALAGDNRYNNNLVSQMYSQLGLEADAARVKGITNIVK